MQNPQRCPKLRCPFLDAVSRPLILVCVATLGLRWPAVSPEGMNETLRRYARKHVQILTEIGRPARVKSFEF